ncbi:hypothetical protein BHM03_00037547 [Ensete ventricosum]|nr:hypothetical protein BHM03_00037547 [Ensete ventricosum]
MKTTKGGKVMNPTDAYRKELRKKELKRVRKTNFPRFDLSLRVSLCYDAITSRPTKSIMVIFTRFFLIQLLSQNKKERKKVREVGILKKDPEAIREQIEKLEKMSK